MKVSELTGPLLDLWVAKAEGKEAYIHDGYCFLYSNCRDWHRVPAGDYSPSTDWSQGGPLIQKYGVLLSPPESMVHVHSGGWQESGYWSATIFRKGKYRRKGFLSKTDPLLIAMRCVVAFKFGEEVPDEH